MTGGKRKYYKSCLQVPHCDTPSGTKHSVQRGKKKYWQRLFLYSLLLLSIFGTFGLTIMAATSPQPASLTAQGNAGLHLSHSAPSTICPFQRLRASSLEKKHLQEDCRCSCSLDMGFSSSLSFRGQLSYEQEDLSHLMFPELLQSSILFTPVTLSCQIFIALAQKPESWGEDRPSSALWLVNISAGRCPNCRRTIWHVSLTLQTHRLIACPLP